MRGVACLVLVMAVSACGPRVVDPACVTYIACQAAFDDAANVDPVDTGIYAEDGDCWAGDPTTADRCATECAEGTDIVRATADDAGLDLAACVESDA